MEQSGVRNLVLLALGQVGVLVGGVLSSGAVYKWYAQESNIIPVPKACEWMTDYGWAGLVLPVVWLPVAVLFTRRGGMEGFAVIVAGWGLLVSFLLAAWLGAVHPWVRLMGSYDSFSIE